MPQRPPCIEIVDEKMAQVLRAKSPAERLEIAFSLWRFARDTIRRNVAREHPDWPDDRVQRETARRLLSGDE
jgi:hypothetical protein